MPAVSTMMTGRAAHRRRAARTTTPAAIPKSRSVGLVPVGQEVDQGAQRRPRPPPPRRRSRAAPGWRGSHRGRGSATGGDRVTTPRWYGSGAPSVFGRSAIRSGRSVGRSARPADAPARPTRRTLAPCTPPPPPSTPARTRTQPRTLSTYCCPAAVSAQSSRGRPACRRAAGDEPVAPVRGDGRPGRGRRRRRAGRGPGGHGTERVGEVDPAALPGRGRAPRPGRGVAGRAPHRPSLRARAQPAASRRAGLRLPVRPAAARAAGDRERGPAPHADRDLSAPGRGRGGPVVRAPRDRGPRAPPARRAVGRAGPAGRHRPGARRPAPSRLRRRAHRRPRPGHRPRGRRRPGAGLPGLRRGAARRHPRPRGGRRLRPHPPPARRRRRRPRPDRPSDEPERGTGR